MRSPNSRRSRMYGSSCARSGAISFETESPTISSAVYPYNRSAPLFQLRIVPFKSFPMTASSVDSTIEAAKEMACSARRRSATSPAKTRKVIPLEATETCNKSNESFGLWPTIGPNPILVPHIAIPEYKAIAVVTPLGPNLNAAQSRNGTIKRPRERLIKLLGKASRKRLIAAAVSETSSKTPSIQRRGDHGAGDLSTQLSISGVTTNAPTPSPIHHVSHSEPKFAHVSAPPRHRLALPI